MGKKVTTGLTNAKQDVVINQVVSQLGNDGVKVSSNNSELTVDVGEKDVFYITLIAYNNRGNIITFPSFSAYKGQAIGYFTIGSTEQARIFETDENGILKLDVRTSGLTTIGVLGISRARKTQIKT